MERRVKSALTATIALFLLVSCSHTPEPEVTIEETAKITLATTTAETSAAETESLYPGFEYTVNAPLVMRSDSNTKPVIFYRDISPIKGRITYPEGEGPFKTVIISSGLYGRLGRYSNKVKSYTERGYAVVEFNFQNGAPPPGYADPEYLGDFIYDEVLDLFAVIDSMKYIPDVDLSNLYLYGHSMGGLVASYCGTMRQDQIKGLILVDPSFYAADIMNFEGGETITTDIYPLFAECNIPAVLITGTEGSFGEDPHFFDEAMEAFPNIEYVVIDDADHHMDGAASEKVVERSIEAMTSWEVAEKA